MKKKVGLLNFHYVTDNYGAVLQASALNYIVNGLGYDAEHIDFIPLTRLARFKKMMKAILTKIDVFNLILGSRPRNSHIFEDFRKVWLCRSEKTIHQRDELFSLKIYDSVVVGSDQVWRTAYTRENMSSYFLDFCDEKTKRISYAASFGQSYWELEDESMTDGIRRLLEKFHAISVREDSGVSLCRTKFGVKAKQVLDPTLLAGSDFFQEILNTAKESSEKSDIVYYKLDVDDEFKSMLSRLEDELGLIPENIYHKEVNSKVYYNPVPEWLEKINKSSFVITDSFHCVCFSVLFNKPFAILVNKDRGLARLSSLLRMLEIDEERICQSNDEVFSLIKSSHVIDYNKVNRRLASLRQDSVDFLVDSLAD